jgi:hypothetical protein
MVNQQQPTSPVSTRVEGRLSDTITGAVEQDNVNLLGEWLDDPTTHIEDTEALKNQTALLWAAQKGSVECLQLLIISGANLEATMLGAATPLFLASQEGHQECVRLLLQAGANPNAKMTNGATPIFIASLTGEMESVRLLLKFNADPNIVTTAGDCALGMAQEEGHEGIVQLLVAHGAADATQEASLSPEQVQAAAKAKTSSNPKPVKPEEIYADVPSFEMTTDPTGNEVAMFKVSVVQGKRVWTVFKRYSEFKALYDRVKGDFGHVEFPNSYLPRALQTPPLIAERRRKLADFLHTLVSQPKHAGLKWHLHSFLGVDAHENMGSSSSNSSSSGHQAVDGDESAEELFCDVHSFELCEGTETSSSPYFVFKLSVVLGEHSWNLRKRFTEFRNFYDRIKDECGDIQFPSTYMPWALQSDANLEQRRLEVRTVFNTYPVVLGLTCCGALQLHSFLNELLERPLHAGLKFHLYNLLEVDYHKKHGGQQQECEKVKVELTGCKTGEDGSGTFAVYTLKVNVGGRGWVLAKRFSEFKQLRDKGERKFDHPGGANICLSNVCSAPQLPTIVSTFRFRRHTCHARFKLSPTSKYDARSCSNF